MPLYMKPKKVSRKLSDHFSKRDFLCKCGKCDGSLKISLGLLGGLEFLRSLAKNRINIVKGFECVESTEAKKKFNRNYHAIGIAADIVIDKLSPKEAFSLACQVPEFKGIGLGETYIHVDTRKDAERALWVKTAEGNTPLTDKNQLDYFDEPILS